MEGELKQITSDEVLKVAIAGLEDGFRLTLWAYEKNEVRERRDVLCVHAPFCVNCSLWYVYTVQRAHVSLVIYCAESSCLPGYILCRELMSPWLYTVQRAHVSLVIYCAESSCLPGYILCRELVSPWLYTVQRDHVSLVTYCAESSCLPGYILCRELMSPWLYTVQ